MFAVRNTIVVAALLIAAPAALQAQEDTDVVPGDRVRVTTPTIPGDRLVGTVNKVMADSVALEVDSQAELVEVPLSSVAKLEVSTGKKSNMLKGMGIGLLVGAFAGAAIGFADGDDPPGWFSFTAGEKAALGGMVLGTVGGVLGGLVGLASPTERWEEVPIDDIRVGLSKHANDGISVSASIRW